MPSAVSRNSPISAPMPSSWPFPEKAWKFPLRARSTAKQRKHREGDTKATRSASVSILATCSIFLRAAADGPISIELKDEQSAGQMRPLADESYRYRYIIMPMRI